MEQWAILCYKSALIFVVGRDKKIGNAKIIA